jgi:YD repeat-containing protein
LGETTRYTYDFRDRQTSSTNALNQTTSTTYDAIGNVLSITDASGNTTRYVYDALNRKTAETNALNLSRTFAYDAVGSLVKNVDRNGRVRTFNYDAIGRQVSENWLDSSGSSIRQITSSYDAIGRLTLALTQIQPTPTSTMPIIAYSLPIITAPMAVQECSSLTAMMRWAINSPRQTPSMGRSKEQRLTLTTT